ncbi:MAG: HTH-type transcriptional repressor Bm3R1 [Stenotrophomonas maltophilia]|nr:MAG: HTH-type transcriptional repressor Bm3R1 [Stenotrophomonas maltophilia]
MAYRVTSARQEQFSQQRERLLELALERVSAAGFAGLSMQGLAEGAGIATGSLYRYFRNKGELAVELFARASQHELDALAEVLGGSGTADARLAAGLRQFAARAWHSRRLAFALIAEPVEPEVDVQRLRYREAYAELFVELLDEGIAQGRFAAGPTQLLAACLVGACAEVLVGPLSPQARAARAAGQPGPGQEAVSQALVQFCLRAVGAPIPEDSP